MSVWNVKQLEGVGFNVSSAILSEPSMLKVKQVCENDLKLDTCYL